MAKVKKLTPLPKLLQRAQKVFNAWVRNRDHGKPCVSCGSFNTAHASHFYAAGSYTGLRFIEENCHSSCVSCNTYKHGNLHEYRRRLVDRIGDDGLQTLDKLATMGRFKKYSREDLELIIKRYSK